MISGIGWVSELVEIAGGIDVFPQLAAGNPPRTASSRREAGDRAAPDSFIGSWCGKKFVPEKVAARPGFAGCRRSPAASCARSNRP